jgi:hypothetical protein
MPCYPPSFLEALLEASNFVETQSKNDAYTKEELCKSLEVRLSVLISKAVSAPTGGSFAIFNRERSTD